MPTLQFKGKNIIWNHHLYIPYCALEEDKNLHSDLENADGNMIIEGDNLLALKTLTLTHAGQIKCIFIDPPYNTGNDIGEGKSWTYYDDVDNPLIKDWINKEVKKDDLTRHDKWLCMMTPRLKLLRDLLSENGAIFITIDDNEYANLKSLMDEIFGEENFVANVVWQARKSVQNDTDISVNHNYVLIYAKNRRLTEKRLDKNNFDRWNKINGFALRPLALDKSKFKNEEKGRFWKADPFDAPGKRKSVDLNYEIINPNTNKPHLPLNGRHWSRTKKEYEKLFKDEKIIFGKNGKSKPQIKVFWDDKKEFGEVETSWWGEGSSEMFVEDGIDFETAQEWTTYGTTTGGSQLLKKIFDSEKVFNNPKPIELLKHIIKLSTEENDIILDSFAGSGTTMHAVMELNKTDKTNRKCILIQMRKETNQKQDENICKDLTRERIIRSIKIKEYDYKFKYYKLGNPIDEKTLLSDNPPTFKDFSLCIYYLCTGKSLAEDSIKFIDEKTYFVGEYENKFIYLIYTNNSERLAKLALDDEFVKKISNKHSNKQIIVYAPNCYFNEEDLKNKNIEFISIPYGLFKKVGA